MVRIDNGKKRTPNRGAPHRFGALPAAILLIAGCTVPDPPPPPPGLGDLPPEFSAAPGVAGEIDERWWESFDDPLLDALVDRALAGNPAIGQAVARLDQARAIARIESADLLPTIRAGLDALESGSEGPAVAPDQFDLSLDIAWEADLWGRIDAERDAARAEAFASAADLQGVRQLIVAETARTYFAVIEAQQQIALSTRVLGTYDELIRQLGLRVEAGIAPQSLNALATADRETARAGLERRREDYQRLLRRLDILVGDYPDGETALAERLPLLPADSPAGVPAALLDRRPDVRAARYAIEAAGFRVDAARASFLPSLTLTGSAGTSARDFLDLFDPDFFLWSIAGRLLQPIFEGGRLRAQLDLRAGERDEALQAYAETALQALFEVETALAVAETLAAQEQAFDRSAEAAEQAVDISVLRYRAGIESFFNVLEAQQRALAARSAYLAARRARLDNRVALHLAIGGGLVEGATAARG